MSREAHVPFYERPGVQLPRPTHRVPQRRTRDGSRMRPSVLCQSCREDDGRPVDVGCQEQASNHPKRLSLRVVVVSVGGNVEHDSAGVDQKDERK
jgi:hypothetical protein